MRTLRAAHDLLIGSAFSRSYLVAIPLYLYLASTWCLLGLVNMHLNVYVVFDVYALSCWIYAYMIYIYIYNPSKKTRSSLSFLKLNSRLEPTLVAQCVRPSRLHVRRRQRGRHRHPRPDPALNVLRTCIQHRSCCNWTRISGRKEHSLTDSSFSRVPRETQKRYKMCLMHQVCGQHGRYWPVLSSRVMCRPVPRRG